MEEKVAVVVDGNELVAASLVHWLQSCGLRAVVAPDGTEALALIESSRPDVILVNLVVRVRGARELLAFVARSPDLCQIPVIVIDTAEPSRHRGVQGRFVIRTPLDQREFEQLISMVVNRGVQARALQAPGALGGADWLTMAPPAATSDPRPAPTSSVP